MSKLVDTDRTVVVVRSREPYYRWANSFEDGGLQMDPEEFTREAPVRRWP